MNPCRHRSPRRLFTLDPVVLAAAVFLGCASGPTGASTTGTSTGVQNRGSGAPPGAGFVPVADAVCDPRVCQSPGAGGVQTGATYRYDGSVPVTVYRVFGGPGRRNGRWWTLDAPQGSAVSYRSRYEICPAWNDLTQAIGCPLRPGATVVVGPGQSARCPDATEYGTSDALQVFIATPDTSVDMDACHPVPWAPASQP